MNEIKWKTIKSFLTPIEAQIAHTKLESEGIESFLRDQYTIGINYLYSNALGGVRLDVKEEDVEKAILSLGEIVSSTDKKCEKCGSTEIQKKDATWRAAFFFFFFMHIPLPFRRTKYRCQKCGYEFLYR